MIKIKITIDFIKIMFIIINTLIKKVKTMHIGKSTQHSLLHHEEGSKDIKWLATQLNKSYNVASIMGRSKYTGIKNIEKLAKIFNMKVSEFIALGEDK